MLHDEMECVAVIWSKLCGWTKPGQVRPKLHCPNWCFNICGTVFTIAREIRSQRNTCRIKTHKCVSFHVLLFIFIDSVFDTLLCRALEQAIGSFVFHFFFVCHLNKNSYSGHRAARYPLPRPLFNFIFTIFSLGVFCQSFCFSYHFHRTHVVLFKTTAAATAATSIKTNTLNDRFNSTLC